MTTTPLTDQQLDAIEQRANAATPGPWSHTDSGAIIAPLTQQHIADVWEPSAASRNGDFIEAARDAVSALVAEVRRLRAAAEVFRAEFGNVTVKGRDGNWANVADWIATGARIPACAAFYPHHTDTRCTKPKGHRGNHRAFWGNGDMAWPYDPRETVQPPRTAEETHVVADDSDDPEHVDDCPGCPAAAVETDGTPA